MVRAISHPAARNEIFNITTGAVAHARRADRRSCRSTSRRSRSSTSSATRCARTAARSASTRRAQLIGYDPATTLEDGLDRYVAWYRELVADRRWLAADAARRRGDRARTAGSPSASATRCSRVDARRRTRASTRPAHERATYQAKRADAPTCERVGALEAAGMRVVERDRHARPRDPREPLAGADAVEVATARARARRGAARHRRAQLPLHPLPPRPRRCPQAVADRIKRDWVGELPARAARRASCSWRVADGAPVGFLAVLAARRRARDRPDRRRARGARRAAPGARSSRAFHERAAGRCDAVEVGTQVANTPRDPLLRAARLRGGAAAYDLHMHVAMRIGAARHATSACSSWPSSATTTRATPGSRASWCERAADGRRARGQAPDLPRRAASCAPRDEARFAQLARLRARRREVVERAGRAGARARAAVHVARRSTSRARSCSSRWWTPTRSRPATTTSCRCSTRWPTPASP